MMKTLSKAWIRKPSIKRPKGDVMIFVTIFEINRNNEELILEFRDCMKKGEFERWQDIS